MSSTQSTSSLSNRLITVEPVVFIVLAIQGFLINLRTQYIEYKLAEQHNYTIPNVGAANSTCWVNETNSTTSEIQKEIEAETAVWLLYMKDISVFLPIVTATVLAAASDFIGRRPALVIGSLGHLLTSCIFFVVSIFNLPIWLLLCAEVCLGLGGDSVLIEVVAAAYVVDIYTAKQRTNRLVVLAMLTYISFGISQIVIGQILQATNNFVLSFGCAVGLAILNLLYVSIPCFIPESISDRTIPKGLIKQLFVKYYSLFKKKEGSNKKPIILMILFLSIFFYDLVHGDLFLLITIYGIASPFCWTPRDTGIYAVMVNMMPAFCSLAAVRVLSVCLSNFWILHISYISAISEILVTALAQSSIVLLYAAPATGFIRTLAQGIYKAQLATLVNKNEQGVLFGFHSLVSSIAKVLSPIVLNPTYAAFVKVDKAHLTFFLSAGLLGIPVILNGILHIASRRYGREETARYESFSEEEPEESIDETAINS